MASAQLSVQIVYGLEELPLQDVIRVTALGFYDYPVMEYMFPDTKRRKDDLHWMYSKVVPMYVEWDDAFHVIVRDKANNDEIVGVAMGSYVPETGAKSETLAAEVWGGMYMMPFAVGLNVFMRTWQVGDFVSDRHYKMTRGKAHWYVRSVSVDPKCQGKGVGTFMLTALNAHFKKIKDIPIYLCTNKPKNEVFYNRLGYKTLETLKVVSTSIPHYDMLHD